MSKPLGEHGLLAPRAAEFPTPIRGANLLVFGASRSSGAGCPAAYRLTACAPQNQNAAY